MDRTDHYPSHKYKVKIYIRYAAGPCLRSLFFAERVPVFNSKMHTQIPLAVVEYRQVNLDGP